MKSLKYIKEHYPRTNDIFAVSSKLAPYFIKLILHTSITANQVSFSAFLFIFIPASLIAFGNYGVTLIGAILLQVPIILDHADGTIARIKGTAGNFGEYYSAFLHDFIPQVIMAGLCISSYRFFNNPIFLIVGLIVIIAMNLTRYSRTVKDKLAVTYMIKNNKRIKTAQGLNIFKSNTSSPSILFCEPKTKYKFLTQFIFFFNTFSHLNYIMFLLAVFNIIHYAIFFYAPFYISIAIIKVSIELKKGMGEYRYD